MGFKPWLSRAIGLYEDKYDEEIDRMMKECAENKSFLNVYYAYGMKPTVECKEDLAE